MTADRSLLDPEYFEDGPLCPRGCGVPTHRVHRIYRNHQTAPYHDCPRLRAEPFFATDHVEGTFSNLPAVPITYETIVGEMREAMATFRSPTNTRDGLVGLVRDRLTGHGYRRVHLVFGERAPGHVVVHALAFIPAGVLRVVREEIADDIAMTLLVDVSATDTGVAYTVPEHIRELAATDPGYPNEDDQVLADWCEERGDLRRAAHLRLGTAGASIARAALRAAL